MLINLPTDDKTKQPIEPTEGAESEAADKVSEREPAEDATREAEDTAETVSGADEVAELQQRVEELQAKERELSDRYVRLVAEFDNFRRRTRENEQAIRNTAAEAVIVELLPVIDNFEFALAAAEGNEDDPLAQGVTLIRQQLTDVLSRHGLAPIDAVGQPFDAASMEAVARAEATDDVEAGHVVAELRKGYKLHDKVLRPSQVTVAGE